jgi:hypothetical protein
MEERETPIAELARNLSIPWIYQKGLLRVETMTCRIGRRNHTKQNRERGNPISARHHGLM